MDLQFRFRAGLQCEVDLNACRMGKSGGEFGDPRDRQGLSTQGNPQCGDEFGQRTGF